MRIEFVNNLYASQHSQPLLPENRLHNFSFGWQIDLDLIGPLKRPLNLLKNEISKRFDEIWEISRLDLLFWGILWNVKIKENGFKLTKERSRKYPAKTNNNADYTNDIALLANAPAQAETLQHSQERTAAGIGFHVNAHKTEYKSKRLHLHTKR